MEQPQASPFRPMTNKDIAPVLAIILAHDEDDHEDAKASFKRGVDGYYVLDQGAVIGVTGARPIDETDRSFMLGWTYLDTNFRGQGLGTLMLTQLEKTLQGKARKIFATTSDWDEGRLYADAIRMYEKAGFAVETKHADYYDAGEAQIVLGKRLEEASNGEEPEPELGELKISYFDEIEETDDAYFVDWKFSGGRACKPAVLEKILTRIRKAKGRVVFASAPSNATTVLQYFETCGFRSDGRLRDFYADNLHEERLRYDLT